MRVFFMLLIALILMVTIKSCQNEAEQKEVISLAMQRGLPNLCKELQALGRMRLMVAEYYLDHKLNELLPQLKNIGCYAKVETIQENTGYFIFVNKIGYYTPINSQDEYISFFMK